MFISEALLDEFCKINWIFKFLLEKYPISKNKSAEIESEK